MQRVNLLELIRRFSSEGGRTLIGVTGQAGAGKTRLCNTLKGDMPCVIDFDWFFRLSRGKRRAWIEDEECSYPDQWVARDQTNWWDFKRAAEVLQQVKSGQRVVLRGVYNREDNGELTGTVVIVPNLIVVVDGVPLPLLPPDLLDHCVFLHAEPDVRMKRLLRRDPRAGEAAQKRWLVTQRFEIPLFLSVPLATMTLLDDSTDIDGEMMPPDLPLLDEAVVRTSLEEQKKALEA